MANMYEQGRTGIKGMFLQMIDLLIIGVLIIAFKFYEIVES